MRSAKLSGMDRKRKEERIVKRMEMKGLKWCGHIMRTEEDRRPKRTSNRTPPGI
jgi:hypothetical protein